MSHAATNAVARIREAAARRTKNSHLCKDRGERGGEGEGEGGYGYQVTSPPDGRRGKGLAPRMSVAERQTEAELQSVERGSGRAGGITGREGGEEEKIRQPVTR